jgi:hypothetical protein
MSPTRLTRRAFCTPQVFVLFLVLAGIGWTLLPRLSEHHVARPTAPQAADAPSPARENYGRLPLSFEANDGQTDPEVKFLARRRLQALPHEHRGGHPTAERGARTAE